MVQRTQNCQQGIRLYCYSGTRDGETDPRPGNSETCQANTGTHFGGLMRINVKDRRKRLWC